MAQFQINNINVVSENWGEDTDDFFVQAHCEVQSADDPGGEAFIANIVSPKALQKEMNDQSDFSYELGRGYLIVNDFDKSKILEILQKFLEGSKANSWNELSDYVERYFDWI